MPSEGVTIELAVVLRGEHQLFFALSVESRERSVGITRLPACTFGANKGMSQKPYFCDIPISKSALYFNIHVLGIGVALPVTLKGIT